MAIVATAVVLIPLIYLVLTTAEYGLAAWWDRVASARVAELAIRSMSLAVVVGIACLILGVGLAVLVTRTDLPMRRLIAVLAAVPLAVPSYVAGFSWLAVADLWDSSTRFTGFTAAAVVLTLYTYPYVYLPVAGALVWADRTSEDVARSLGKGPLRTLWTVTLPQIRPAIAGGGLLAMFYVLSDFGAVSVLRFETFTRAIFTALNAGFNRLGAVSLSTVLLVLTIIILAVESRFRRAAAGPKLNAPRPSIAAPLGKGRFVALAATLVVLIPALGVPAASMARWFAAGVSRPGSVRAVLDAAWGSLSLSLAGALLTVLLALPIGLLIARNPGRISATLERLTYVAYALPGVVVGLSLVAFGVAAFGSSYQTVWLVALGYATLFLPLAVAAVAGAAAQAPRGLEEVGESLGRPRWYVLSRVTVPLTMPGIGAGAALVFLTCMKELPATLMLRPIGTDTLATRLWSATTGLRYAEAAPYAVLLVLLAAIPTWVLVRRSGITTALRPQPVEAAGRGDGPSGGVGQGPTASGPVGTDTAAPVSTQEVLR